MRGIQQQTVCRLLGDGNVEPSFGHVVVQAQQEHGGRGGHIDGVRGQSGHYHHGVVQKSAVAGPPSPHQEAHCGQQKYHTADVQASGTATKSTMRDNNRELL